MNKATSKVCSTTSQTNNRRGQKEVVKNEQSKKNMKDKICLMASQKQLLLNNF